MDDLHSKTTGNSGVRSQAIRELLQEIGRILSEEEETIQKAEATQDTSAESPVVKPHPGDGGTNRKVISEAFATVDARITALNANTNGLSQTTEEAEAPRNSNDMWKQSRLSLTAIVFGLVLATLFAGGVVLAGRPTMYKTIRNTAIVFLQRGAASDQIPSIAARTPAKVGVTPQVSDRQTAASPERSQWVGTRDSFPTSSGPAPTPTGRMNPQQSGQQSAGAGPLSTSERAGHPANGLPTGTEPSRDHRDASRAMPEQNAPGGANPEELANPPTATPSHADVGPSENSRSIAFSATETSATSPARTALPIAPSPFPASSAGIAPTPAANGSQMILRAKVNCWVEVREKSGRVLLKRVLRRDETWPVPAGLDLLLTTGNAGATELIVDGTTAPPLGPMHAVRRDILLTPDLIKAGDAPIRSIVHHSK